MIEGALIFAVGVASGLAIRKWLIREHPLVKANVDEIVDRVSDKVTQRLQGIKE